MSRIFWDHARWPEWMLRQLVIKPGLFSHEIGWIACDFARLALGRAGAPDPRALAAIEAAEAHLRNPSAESAGALKAAASAAWDAEEDAVREIFRVRQGAAPLGDPRSDRWRGGWLAAWAAEVAKGGNLLHAVDAWAAWRAALDGSPEDPDEMCDAIRARVPWEVFSERWGEG